VVLAIQKLGLDANTVRGSMRGLGEMRRDGRRVRLSGQTRLR